MRIVVGGCLKRIFGFGDLACQPISNTGQMVGGDIVGPYLSAEGLRQLET